MVDRQSKPKTLVEETHSKLERNCSGLRNYAEPPDVKIFKYTPDWSHKFDIGNSIGTEKPYIPPETGFNGRRK